MKLYLTTLLTVTAAFSLTAETTGEKRWRLRAEILERQLELAQMELAARGEAAPTVDSAGPTESTSVPVYPVNSFGVRLPSADSDGLSIAQLAPSTVEQSAATKRSDTPAGQMTVPSTVDVAPQMATSPEVASVPAAAAGAEKVTPSPWSASYQMLKPSTRVYFDTGEDDPGEFDVFKEGDIGISLDFLTVSLDYELVPKAVWIGGFVSGGISTAASNTAENAGSAATLLWSAGVSIGFKGLPVAIEAGIMQGVSASETLRGGARDDTAFFVGFSLDKIIQKTSFLGGKP